MRRHRLRWVLLLAAAVAIVCGIRRRQATHGAAPAPAAAPSPAPEPTPEPAPAPAWMPPVDGVCPPGYPVKANTNSGIYHLPGGRFYDRTVPERCYATAAGAEADGYRRAKA